MSTQTVVVVNQKSMATGLLLTFFFGPLGMLYSTVLGAFIMFFVNILAFVFTAGIGLFVTWPIGVIWSGIAISNHNSGLVSGGAAANQPERKTPQRQETPPSSTVTERKTEPKPVSRSRDEAYRQPSVRQGGVASNCTECGTAMEAEDKFCFNCGSERKKQLFCAGCGSAIDVQSKFCSSCGTKVSQ